jgi:hypothetical protein
MRTIARSRPWFDELRISVFMLPEMDSFTGKQTYLHYLDIVSLFHKFQQVGLFLIFCAGGCSSNGGTGLFVCYVCVHYTWV